MARLDRRLEAGVDFLCCVTVYPYGVLCFHEPTRRGSAARGETGSEGER